ncbi:MAG TPA: hypothetical protein VGK23_00955 [Methanomassiliicoccales archaeon]|jgi:hypothetical protein
MTDSTNTSNPNDIGHDENFKENVRRQLLAKGAEGTTDPIDTYVPMVQLPPAEGRAVRWFGSVIGSLLFLFGAIWFLAIIGYAVPWYAVFPIMAMFVGGFFITAALATRKDLSKLKR